MKGPVCLQVVLRIPWGWLPRRGDLQTARLFWMIQMLWGLDYVHQETSGQIKMMGRKQKILSWIISQLIIIFK